ncbi:MAG: DUF1190 domain-containing protein [Hyphomicrobiaceae bacterium]
MAEHSSYRAFVVAAAVLLTAALAGCGGSKKKSETPVVQGIYTTASDCADAGHLDYDACSDLISAAVEIHEKDAPTYTELRFCEGKEGEGKCENTANEKIRPKLLAFLITVSDPPTGIPLYAHAKGELGFRDLAGKVYLHSNDQLVFSEHAVTVFERNAARRFRR